ncbi:hypothetical protein WOLCODRAFT_146859 [Wolfiporia cocos MD-104 SS10]|uniref:Uncharacterized protein n=1 Tax=Wolfiporia cocos (strain MD-104) TaxID=742152 RepID=A0A2H3JJY5_WOLCO|nr:hypothetical protein WOLCODRAFT_146859 [Wolfiporia cocos MD-104 SS10]
MMSSSATSALPSSTSPSYATDESAEILWYEQSINAAVYIGAMAWGLQVVVYFQALKATLRSPIKGMRLWTLFTSVSFSLTTVNICCNINFNERAWIDEREYPGGPISFFSREQALPVNVASIATSVICMFLTNGLLIYRCHALWNKAYITLFLCATLVACTVMSILHSIQVVHAPSGSWDDTLLSLCVPYASLTMSLNVLLVLILVFRLLDLSRKLPKSLPTQTHKDYTSLEALLIESALPYGTVSFVFSIFFGVRSTIANLFLSLIIQLQGITSGLIVTRMANGHAWSTDLLRSIGPNKITFRGQLGRSPNSDAVADDVSMFALGDEPREQVDVKVPTMFA